MAFIFQKQSQPRNPHTTSACSSWSYHEPSCKKHCAIWYFTWAHCFYKQDAVLLGRRKVKMANKQVTGSACRVQPAWICSTPRSKASSLWPCADSLDNRLTKLSKLLFFLHMNHGKDRKIKPQCLSLVPKMTKKFIKDLTILQINY